jgi:hypothetical protein
MSTALPFDPGTLLLEDVEAFLRETGMGASTFGRKAMADSTFVRELRLGRSLYLATENKVRGQIAIYRRIGRFDDPRNHPTAPRRHKPAQARSLPRTELAPGKRAPRARRR